MLHLEITMAVPCYLPLYPCSSCTQSARGKDEVLESHLGKKSNFGRCFLHTPPLFAFCKYSPLENKAPAAVGGGVENTSQVGGEKTGGICCSELQ